jgi:hypothetical protein
MEKRKERTSLYLPLSVAAEMIRNRLRTPSCPRLQGTPYCSAFLSIVTQDKTAREKGTASETLRFPPVSLLSDRSRSLSDPLVSSGSPAPSAWLSSSRSCPGCLSTQYVSLSQSLPDYCEQSLDHQATDTGHTLRPGIPCCSWRVGSGSARNRHYSHTVRRATTICEECLSLQQHG